MLADDRAEAAIPANAEHWHGELSFREFCICFHVFGKCSIVLEPCPQRSWGAVGAGVDVFHLVREGAGVNGLRIVKPGWKLPLLSGDQRLGDVADLEKPEMPGAWGFCYLVPGRDAWQRDVEDRQGPHFVRNLRGIGIGHHPAQIMADDVHACTESEL